jgi:cyclopropane fatty-acyl-phospholipid synthase-like methyltransferase
MTTPYWNSEELEQIPCDLCGATTSSTPTIRADGLSVVRCGCGLAFLNPRPRAERVDRLYGLDYFTGRGDGVGYEDYVSDTLEHVRNPKSLQNQVASLLSETVGFRGKTVWEVGCATGSFLSIARGYGASVVGVEPSSEVAEIARRQFDVTVHNRRLEEIDATEPADIVVALEVIEHVLSPTAFLAKCRSLVRSGGSICLTTPNYGNSRLAGARWPGFARSFEHLYYYDANTLSTLLSRSGFAPVVTRRINPRYVQPNEADSRWMRLARKGARVLLPIVPSDVWGTGLLVVARAI